MLDDWLSDSTHGGKYGGWHDDKCFLSGSSRAMNIHTENYNSYKIFRHCDFI